MQLGLGFNHFCGALGWASAVMALAGMASFALVATAIDVLRPIVLQPDKIQSGFLAGPTGQAVNPRRKRIQHLSKHLRVLSACARGHMERMVRICKEL
jgi:hypothetical protein